MKKVRPTPYLRDARYIVRILLQVGSTLRCIAMELRSDGTATPMKRNFHDISRTRVNKA